MNRVNERSTAYLTVTFRDKAGAAQAPASASYRIDDVESGAEVRANTPIAAPGASVEIRLTTEDNTLRNPGAPLEIRRVTVTGQYGVDDGVNAEHLYEVANLTGVGNS